MDVKLYSMSKIDNEENNTATVKFLLSSKIEKGDEVLYQTMLALVGEIGGFLGLILGVSLLDLKNIEAKIAVLFNSKN